MNYSHRERPLRTRKFRDTDYASKYEIRARDNYTCQYCGRTGTTVDHIVPRVKGGLSTWGNFCVACHDCNQTKGHKSLTEVGFQEPVIPSILPPVKRKPHRLQDALTRALETAVL